MIGPLPPRPTGSSAEARFQQWIWDTISSGQPTVRQVPTAKVSRTTRGMIVEPDAGRGTGGNTRTRKLILKDHEAADYLICRPWNRDYWLARRSLRTSLGTEPTSAQIATEMGIELDELTTYLADEVVVAKSQELIADDFDGETIDFDVEDWDGATLTVDNKTLTFEYHSATLRTVTDDDAVEELQTVVPRFRPEDTIIYAITSSDSEMTVDGNSIRLVDLNLDARAWMKVGSE